MANIFGVPVLACSIFDSDVLMISFSDPEKEMKLDFVKTDFLEDEDFDDGFENDNYLAEFPEFLLACCSEDSRERLMKIWNSEDYTFADDRMEDICNLLGAKALYNEDNIPEGYTKIK